MLSRPSSVNGSEALADPSPRVLARREPVAGAVCELAARGQRAAAVAVVAPEEAARAEARRTIQPCVEKQLDADQRINFLRNSFLSRHIRQQQRLQFEATDLYVAPRPSLYAAPRGEEPISAMDEKPECAEEAEKTTGDVPKPGATTSRAVAADWKTRRTTAVSLENSRKKHVTQQLRNQIPVTSRSEEVGDQTLHVPHRRWYRVATAALAVRSEPDVGSTRTGIVLKRGEVFEASIAAAGVDGRVYLKVQGLRGWLFDDTHLDRDDPSVQAISNSEAKAVLEAVNGEIKEVVETIAA